MDAILKLISDERLPEAKILLQQLVHSQRRNFDAWHLLGRVNHGLGLHEEAARCYEKAIALDPKNPAVHYNLGNVRAQTGDHQAAIACYRKVLLLKPHFAEAVCNLGLVLQELGRTHEAIACYRRFLEHGEPSATLCFNLAHALAETQSTEEAITWYRRALELDPSHANAHLNLGIALYESGKFDEAVALHEKALAAQPGSVAACRALGEALAAQGKPEPAMLAFRRALSLAPDDGLRLRLATMLPVIPASLDELRTWRGRFEEELSLLEKDPLRLEPVGSTNFYLSYHGLNNRELHSRVANLYRRSCPSLLWTAPHCEDARPRSGRARVGFISRHMYNHSVGRTTSGLVAQLSRDRFEVISLFVSPFRNDEIANLIRTTSDRAITIPLDLDAARKAIAELELDILFYQDIGMEPFTYFLAFSRLAPVQCVYFGHPDTSGIPSLDWFISSDLFETTHAPSHYTEQLFLLRDLGNFAYYSRPRLPEVLKSRQDLGLPAEANLYLCPQTLFKFHPEFDAILAAILRADPKGVVLLARSQIPHWVELLRARFARTMPDVVDRIVFIPQRDHRGFLNLLALVDVVLDTLHFNGFNSSLEGFAVGTPIVTLPTELQRGRHTAGMYRKMGFTECIAADADDYVRIAVRLGTDADYRRHVKSEILRRNEVLFEDPRVVQEFERCFREMLARSVPS
jgi:protein O-GlcNAc transferase